MDEGKRSGEERREGCEMMMMMIRECLVKKNIERILFFSSQTFPLRKRRSGKK